jgi:hypothetical protein
MTDDDDCMAEGYMVEAGDTALLIQPGGRIPPFITVTGDATGPSLWRRGATWIQKTAPQRTFLNQYHLTM